MLLGALVQTLLLAVPISRVYAAVTIIAVLGFRLPDTVLVVSGWRENRFLRGVPARKTTVMLAGRDGDEDVGRVGGEKIAVLLLGAKVRRPLSLSESQSSEASSSFNGYFWCLPLYPSLDRFNIPRTET